MPGKTKIARAAKRKGGRGSKSVALYPSLAEARAAAKRRAHVAGNGSGAARLTAEEFDRQMAQPSPWPDEEFAEFLVWLRKSRRTGRYAE